MDKGGSNPTIKFGDLLSKTQKSFPKEYETGVNTYMNFLPQFLGGEMGFRNLYDPQRIAEQQQLQSQFGPTQYSQMLDALKQLDPTGYNLREQTGNAISGQLGTNLANYNTLANSVLGDLKAGTSLTPGQSADLEQQIRRSEASRGNVYGQAPIETEAFTKGMYGQQLYNQRIQNANSVLSGANTPFGASLQFQNSATPEQWIQSIAPVSADRSMAYVNPNAGWLGVNGSNAALQNLLAVQGLNQQGNSSPWGSTLGGIASMLPLLIGAFG